MVTVTARQLRSPTGAPPGPPEHRKPCARIPAALMRPPCALSSFLPERGASAAALLFRMIRYLERRACHLLGPLAVIDNGIADATVNLVKRLGHRARCRPSGRLRRAWQGAPRARGVLTSSARYSATWMRRPGDPRSRPSTCSSSRCSRAGYDAVIGSRAHRRRTWPATARQHDPRRRGVAGSFAAESCLIETALWLQVSSPRNGPHGHRDLV